MQLIKFHNDLNLARTASMHVRLQDAYVLEMKKKYPRRKKKLFYVLSMSAALGFGQIL